jgi:hypothetical protein
MPGGELVSQVEDLYELPASLNAVFERAERVQVGTELEAARADETREGRTVGGFGARFVGGDRGV